MEVVQKKKKNDKKASENLPSIGLAINTTQKKVKIDGLVSSKFTLGCAVLGIVLNIHDDQVVVSLPGGILGSIQYEEISDVIHKMVQDKQTLPKLSDLIKVHQVVRCSVLTKSEDQKKIPLSARLSVINRGLALKHLYE